MVQLQREESSFKNENGQEVRFYRFYVLFNGLKIYLKTEDKTSTRLINQLFE